MKTLFKYASLLMAAAMLFSCHGTIDPNDPSYTGPEPGPEPTPGDQTLCISSDKNLIQTFDDYATITVTLGDEVITEGVSFYDGKNKPVEIPDFKFSTTEATEHVLWASYGTYISDKITINAINVKIPQTPADPDPKRTDFKTRILITEFTGNGCQFCPFMKSIIHEAMNKESMKDKMILTTCHTFNSSDPAYFNEMDFKEFCNVSGYPNVRLDMYQSFNDYRRPVQEFVDIVDLLYNAKKDVAAGIAVNSSLSGNQLVIKATVKSAETAEYRVGAFLLEDGIYGKQTSGTEEWMDTHDGVISHIDAKYISGASARFYGHSLGEIEKGKTADHVFVWDVDKIENARLIGGNRKEFVRSNLHVAVFVSTVGTDGKGNEYYYVNNIIDCPVNGLTPYEYR